MNCCVVPLLIFTGMCGFNTSICSALSLSVFGPFGKLDVLADSSFFPTDVWHQSVFGGGEPINLR